MQEVVPTVHATQNLSSSVRETAPSSVNEDRSRSHDTPTESTLTKLEPGNKRDDAERKNTQGQEMKTENSLSTVKGSRFFQRFRKKRTTNTWQWKSGEVLLLVLATVVTVSINAVPVILYFSLEVSVQVHIKV